MAKTGSSSAAKAPIPAPRPAPFDSEEDVFDLLSVHQETGDHRAKRSCSLASMRGGKDIMGKLETELERLRRLLGLGYHLVVKWIPKDGKLSGEVNGNCIYVYEKEEKPALETLRHEFLDYAISQAIEPYKEIANRLILMVNESAYRTKEKLVEALCRLLNETRL
jgi:hypothetical protein